MKIRIRSNLETKRIEVDDSLEQNPRLSDLKDALSLTYKIPTESMTFCWDISGEDGLWKDQTQPGPDSTLLSMLNIKNGSLLYLCGRLMKTVVEKSYVDSTGSVISKGEHYSLVVDEDSDDNNKASSGEKEAASEQALPPTTTTSTTTSTAAVAADTDTNTSSSSAMDTATSRSDALADVDEVMSAAACGSPSRNDGSDGVRAPDAARRMRLVDDSPYGGGGGRGGGYTHSKYLPPGVDRGLLSPGMEAALRVMESAGTGRLPPSFNMDAQLTEAMDSLNDLDQANIAISMAKTRLDNLEQMEALEMARLQSLGIAASPLPPMGSNDEYDGNAGYGSHEARRRYGDSIGDGYRGSSGGYGDHERERRGEYGNPPATQYTGTRGLSSQAAAPGSTNEALGVNQEVVDSLRAAGVSEGEILMELARLQDEAVAGNLQQAEYTNRAQPSLSAALSIPPSLSIATNNSSHTSHSSNRAREAARASGAWGAREGAHPGGSPLGKLLQEVARKREASEAEIDAIISRGEYVDRKRASRKGRTSRDAGRAGSTSGGSDDAMPALRIQVDRDSAGTSAGASDPALERIRHGLTAILSDPKYSPTIQDRKVVGGVPSLAPSISSLTTANSGGEGGEGGKGGEGGRFNSRRGRPPQQPSGLGLGSRDSGGGGVSDMVVPPLSSSHDSNSRRRRSSRDSDDAPSVHGNSAGTGTGSKKKSAAAGSTGRRRRDQPLSGSAAYTPSFGTSLSTSNRDSTSTGNPLANPNPNPKTGLSSSLSGSAYLSGSANLSASSPLTNEKAVEAARQRLINLVKNTGGSGGAYPGSTMGNSTGGRESFDEISRGLIGQSKAFANADALSYGLLGTSGGGAAGGSNAGGAGDNRQRAGRLARASWEAVGGDGMGQLSPQAPSGPRTNRGRNSTHRASFGENSTSYTTSSDGAQPGGATSVGVSSSYGDGSMVAGYGGDLKDLDLTSVEEDDEIALAMMLSLSEQTK